MQRLPGKKTPPVPLVSPRALRLFLSLTCIPHAALRPGVLTSEEVVTEGACGQGTGASNSCLFYEDGWLAARMPG